MREYSGKPTSTFRSEGWKELDDESPCPTCGAYLIAEYTTTKTLGGKVKIFLGSKQCRNGCAASGS